MDSVIERGKIRSRHRTLHEAQRKEVERLEANLNTARSLTEDLKKRLPPRDDSA
jgi:hypothetical protein